MSASAMTGSHITIALCNSSRDSHIPVLTVHVVSTRTRVITKPDTKVLDLQWALVMNLKGIRMLFNEHRTIILIPYHLAADNFTSSLLELTQLAQEIPKT